MAFTPSSQTKQTPKHTYTQPIHVTYKYSLKEGMQLKPYLTLGKVL